MLSVDFNVIAALSAGVNEGGESHATISLWLNHATIVDILELLNELISIVTNSTT